MGTYRLRPNRSRLFRRREEIQPQKIGLATEQAADLTPELIDKLQISIAEVQLLWPELDKMPGNNTFQKMRELEKRGMKSFGKTSQPSPKSFLDAYKKQLEKFDYIICVTITSKLSGTYNSAVQGRNFLSPEEQKRVFVIDSLNASGGEALLLLRADALIKEGKNVEEIIKELEDLVPRVRLFLMFKDPKWLVASGRISKVVGAVLGRLSKVGVRPFLEMKDGILVRAGIKTGAKEIATGLFKQFETEIKKLKLEEKNIKAVITHCDDIQGAQRLKEMIEKEFENVKVEFINIMNNIVGSLVGPDGLVLCWYAE